MPNRYLWTNLLTNCSIFFMSISMQKFLNLIIKKWGELVHSTCLGRNPANISSQNTHSLPLMSCPICYNRFCQVQSLYSRGSRFLDFFGFSISYSLQLMGKIILRIK
jgi:hypothetical protein